MKVAIVGPYFFSYMHAIRDEFREKGIQADYFDERHSNKIWVKICYRLHIDLLVKERKTQYLNSLRDTIISSEYTDVILIDVEVVDSVFVRALRESGVRVHIYMWDSVKNKSNYLKYLDQLIGKGSFDPEDCKEYGLKYIPLFAQESYRLDKANIRERDCDVSFCGTLHSNRALALRKLKKILDSKSLKYNFLVYFHSKLLLLLMAARSFSNIYFINTISTSGFSKTEITNSVFQSKFVFDVPHNGQCGLTARTFEALRGGANLITLNKNAYTLPKSFHDRIVIINSVENLVDFDFKTENVSDPLSLKEDYFLSISRFVDDLLDLMK